MNPPERIAKRAFDGASHRYRLVLESAPVEDAVRHKLAELQKSAHIKGFRPGRVPYKIIRGIYHQRVTDSIVEQFAIRVSRSTIKDKQLKPLSSPVIEGITKTPSGQYEFDLVLEIFPDVVLKPIKGLQVRRLHAVPDQSRLDAVRDLLLFNPESHRELADSADESAIEALIADQLQKLSRLHLKRQVLDWLAGQYELNVPESMRTREFRRIIENHKRQFADEPDLELREEYQRIAGRRIQLAIILFEIGSSQNIQIPKGEIEALVRKQAKRDPEHEDEILKFYFENPSALAELQSPLFEDYVIDYVLDSSDVLEVELTADQMVAEIGLEIEILG